MVRKAMRVVSARRAEAEAAAARRRADLKAARKGDPEAIQRVRQGGETPRPRRGGARS